MASLTTWRGWRLGAEAVPYLITTAFLVPVLVVLWKLIENNQTKRGDELDHDSGVGGGQLVHDFVGNLPTQWEFYAVIVLIALAYSAYCWRRRKKLRLDQEADDVSKIVSRASDRAVVRELRMRALSSRLWAEVLLGGVVASLFVGLYFSIYVSRYVVGGDSQAVVDAIIQERFRREIVALAKGEYWLRIATESATGIPSLIVGRRKDDEDDKELVLLVGGRGDDDGGASRFVSRDHGLTWTKEDKDGQQKATGELVTLPIEPGEVGAMSIAVSLDENVEITVIEYGARGHGLVATDDGAAYVTADGGKQWRRWTRRDLGLKEREWLVGAVIGETGPRFVVGDEGSVRFLAGDAWKSVDVELESRVTAFEFSADGRHGLIGTADGAAHVTADGGENWRRWTRRDLGLKEREWLVGAVIGETGPRFVVGDEGSLRFLADGAWKLAGVEPESRSGVTAFEFSADGRHGLIGIADGAAHVTADGGENWRRWTRRDLGLKEREWLVGAVIGETGPRFVVGDEGSVRFLAGDAWKSVDVELESRVTAFEFSADGRHGLIGTADGAAHVTADGGENWRWWTQQELGLKENERLVEAVVGGNGPRLAVGAEGSVVVFANGNWSRQSLPDGWTLASNDKGDLLLVNVLSHVVYSESDSKLAVTGSASVWLNEGQKWEQLPVDFASEESVAATALDEEGNPIVVGNKGSVRVGEDTWQSNSEYPSGEEEEAGHAAVVSLDGTLVLAVVHNGEVAIYHNETYSQDSTRKLVDVLPEESELKRRVGTELLAQQTRLGGGADRGGQRQDGTPELTIFEKIGLDSTFWMRFAAMAATIYFVQLLVRLYQYSIRLAAFLDSCADAILLSPGLSDPARKPSFDELVAAIGPDSLDFKPPRFPPTYRLPVPRKRDSYQVNDLEASEDVRRGRAL